MPNYIYDIKGRIRSELTLDPDKVNAYDEIKQALESAFHGDILFITARLVREETV